MNLLRTIRYLSGQSDAWPKDAAEVDEAPAPAQPARRGVITAAQSALRKSPAAVHGKRALVAHPHLEHGRRECVVVLECLIEVRTQSAMSRASLRPENCQRACGGKKFR